MPTGPSWRSLSQGSEQVRLGEGLEWQNQLTFTQVIIEIGRSSARLLPQRHVDLAQLLVEALQLVLPLPRRHACTWFNTIVSAAQPQDVTGKARLVCCTKSSVSCHTLK